MVASSVTSRGRTWSLSEGEGEDEDDDEDDAVLLCTSGGSRSARRLFLMASWFVHEVARMGSVVVRRRWRVRAWPMPRLEGVTRIQGRDIVLVIY